MERNDFSNHLKTRPIEEKSLKKILIYSHHPPTISGGSTATKYLVNNLKGRFKIYIINHQGFRLEKHLKLLPVTPMGHGSFFGAFTFIIVGLIVGFLITVIKRIDVIYAKNISTPGITAYLLAIFTRKPLVIHTSGPDIQTLGTKELPSNFQGKFDALYRKINNFFMNKQLEKSVCVIANCERDLDNLKRIGYEKKSTLIYNGLNYNLFKRDKKSRQIIRKNLLGHEMTNRRIFVFVGQQTFQKNIPLFEKIANQFPNNLFMIIGASKHEIKGNLVKITKQNHRDLVRYLSASDFFLLTSRGEGLSNALLEAISAGNYPISTNVGDHWKLFEYLNIGKIINDKNYLDIISHVLEYEIKDLEEIVIKSRENLKERFSWKLYTEKVGKILSHV